MRKEMRIALSALASLALTAATFAMPVPATAAKQSSAQSQETQTQSVSGRIASVEKSSFTLAVGSGSTNPGHQMAADLSKDHDLHDRQEHHCRWQT